MTDNTMALIAQLKEASSERERLRVERDEARERFEWAVDRGDVVFSNQDCVMHLPRPDCQESLPHLIDACGAFEPKPDRVMSWDEIDDTIADIMINDGPDRHCDGHEVIANFVAALITGSADQWLADYAKEKALRRA